MPDRCDRDAIAAHPIKNNIRSASDHQLSDSRLSAGAAQVGMVSEGFHNGHDSGGQAGCRVRLVPGCGSANRL